MATPWSAEVRSLFKVLGDGEWHDMKAVTAALAATIAPGKALRRYENYTQKRRDRVGALPAVREPTEDEKIELGRRRLANQAINSVKRKYLVIHEHGRGQKMIRV